MVNVTNTFVSFLFPFTTALPVTLASKDDSSSSSSSPRIRIARQLSSRVAWSRSQPEVSAVAPSPPTRKASWLSRPPPNERRQSCRRINSRRRDWSDELQDSEFNLPFQVAPHDRERGGVPVERSVSFLEQVRIKPKIDTNFVENGLMIDVDSEIEEPTSAAGTENTTDTERSKDSEWSTLSEEAEGIEGFF
jgi:hypothetical protein